METLTQTQESPMEALVKKLKTASQGTIEQLLAFFQDASNTETATEETTVEHDETVVAEMEETMLEETSNGIEMMESNGEVEYTDTLEEMETPEEEPTTEELQNEITDEMPENAMIDIIMEEPKADIEIRLDEIYSIRVVAKEVVSSIEELQNEVETLKAQLATMVSPEELDAKVREVVGLVLRGVQI